MPEKQNQPEKLTKIVNLRVTQSTHKTWKKAAQESDMNMGDWLRSQISVDGVLVPTTKKPSPKKMPKRRNYTPADPELILQISRVGNNLNQISRWCNTHKSASNTIEVVSHLIAIQQQLETLLSSLPLESKTDAHKI